MSDLTVTVGNVTGDNDNLETRNAGVAITIGKALCISSDTYILADCTDAAKSATHFARSTAAKVGEKVIAQRIKNGASYTPGATLTAGVVYCLSEGGNICPAADLTANGDRVQALFTLESGTTIARLIESRLSGVAVTA